MSSLNRFVTLGEISDRIGDGLHGTPEYSENGEYFFINGNNLIDGEIILNEKTKSCSKFEYDKYKKDLSNNTILISINGTIGNLAFYKGENVILGKSACYINIKSDVDKNFIYYALKSSKFQNYIKSQATGSTIKNVSLKLLRDYVLELPDIIQQKRISKILSTLDDKIHLNNQINQTLESIAQAIFKSWFIDFEPVRAKITAKQEGKDPELAAMCAISGKTQAELDQLTKEDFAELQATAALFPDELVESELGEVPRGWGEYSLADLSSVISKGTTPKKMSLGKAQSQSRVPFIKVKDLDDSGNILIESVEYIPSDISENELKRSILESGDILFSIAGTIGRVAIVTEGLENGNINQALAFIRLKNKKIINLITLYLKDNKVQEMVGSKVVQGVQANASLTTIRDLKVSLPNNVDALSNCCMVINTLCQKKQLINEENQVLRNLRDALLPKLLSGEIILSKIMEEI